MIVEDELALLENYGELLQGQHELSLFSDPRDALRHYAEHPHDFDFVLVDHYMPRKTGEGLIFDMKYINPEQPIGLFSSTPDVANIPESFQVPRFAKPLHPSDVIQTMTRLFRV